MLFGTKLHCSTKNFNADSLLDIHAISKQTISGYNVGVRYDLYLVSWSILFIFDEFFCNHLIVGL
jgi:hypothetical protein